MKKRVFKHQKKIKAYKKRRLMGKAAVLAASFGLMLGMSISVHGQESRAAGQKTVVSNIYHRHIGSAAVKGGCYSIAIKHTHQGSSQTGGACYGTSVTHSHTGSAAAGGGCYVVPVYHAHQGNQSSGGACYEAVTHSHSDVCYLPGTCTVQYTAGALLETYDDDCFQHQRTAHEKRQATAAHSSCGKGTIGVELKYCRACGYMSPTWHKFNNVVCGMDESTVTGYRLKCGKEGTVERYNLGCGYQQGQVISYNLTCNKTVDGYERGCGLDESTPCGRVILTNETSGTGEKVAVSVRVEDLSGGKLTLGSQPYTWKDQNGNTLGSGSRIEVSENGTYEVTVRLENKDVDTSGLKASITVDNVKKPAPTAAPTARPTAAPTAKPTAAPTVRPTAAPTAKPTAAPTARPTAAPTARPTAAPTAKPTAAPTAEPTAEPTAAPTAEPTARPTAAPTAEPTAAPTAEPTARPTAKPTAAPTVEPTAKPTIEPAATASPTAKPTEKPTAKPTERPVVKPTAKPTTKPVPSPTVKPTEKPVVKPTAKPTTAPTAVPAPPADTSKKPSSGNGHGGSDSENGSEGGNGSTDSTSPENKKDTKEEQENKEDDRKDEGASFGKGNNGKGNSSDKRSGSSDTGLEDAAKGEDESPKLTVRIKKPVMKDTGSVQAAESRTENEIAYTIGKMPQRGGFFAQPAVKVITVTVSSLLLLSGLFALLFYLRRSVRVYNDDGEGRLVYLGRCMVRFQEEGYAITITEKMIENSCTNRYCIKPGFFKIGKKEGQELIIYKEGKKTTAYLDKEMIVLI